MAVGRFYLQNDVPGYNPPTIRGGWNNVSGNISKKMAKTKYGSITYHDRSENYTQQNTCLNAKFITDGLPYAKTISGSLNYCLGMNESSSNAHFYPQIHIFVTVGDTDVVRGTLLSQSRGGSELITGSSSGIAVSNLTLSSVNASAGDRIVIEVGFFASNTSSTNYTSSLYYGGTNGTDLTANASITTYTGWFEFSNDPTILDNNIYGNIDGVWKTAIGTYENIDGVWKLNNGVIYGNIDGVWKGL
jgi:hypothetical protein